MSYFTGKVTFAFIGSECSKPEDECINRKAIITLVCWGAEVGLVRDISDIPELII